MKTTFLFKNSLYSALVFFGTLLMLSIGYTAWNSTMERASSGSTLNSGSWNTLVDNISDLDSRWSRNGLAIGYAGGNVGIGTMSPRTKLDVNGSAIFQDPNGYILFSSKLGTEPFGTNYDRFEMRVDTGNPVTYIGNTNGGTGSPRALSFLAGSVERMRIDTVGNIGIGTSNPTVRLDVAGAMRGDYLQIDPQDAISEGGEISLAGTNGYSYYIMDTLGGNFRILNNNTSIGATPFSLTLGGNGVFAGTVTANGVLLSSDRNLKKNIETVTGGLDKINAIRGVTYNWKDPNKNSSLQSGVIAQEVETVLPELVSTDEKGMKSVNYAGLSAPIIEAIKELKAQKDSEILELKKENESTQKKYESISKENADIKSRLEKLEQR